MPQNATPQAELSPQQVRTIEQLAIGVTVVRAAEVAGVSRETVHRWSREDWTFQAALNRARSELQEAVERRLLAVADRTPGRSAPRGWPPPSAPTAPAGPPRPNSSRTPASPPSPNAAARPAGCITAWRVRSFSSRPFTNTRTSRFASPPGRAATTTSSAVAATTITPPCGRRPLNGCGFSFAVGRTGRRTMRPPTSPRYVDTGRHW